jgi:WbqC-like protein family
MSRRVAVTQSNYIPWKGYFDLIARVDELVLYDDVQYTRRDWRNRNRVKTPQGTRWLTIPVKTRGRYHQRIDETEVSDPGWAAEHWAVISRSYASAPHFTRYETRLDELYRSAAEEAFLSAVNERFLRALCDLLGIDTAISRSGGHAREAGRTERLVALSRRAGASEYVCGPASRGYLEEGAFAEAGIAVSYMDYSGYPEYPQLHPPFEHRVSVIDLLLNTGPDAPRFMKHLHRREPARA